MSRGSPSYPSGRLTKKELSPGSDNSPHSGRQSSFSHLRRVAGGRIVKASSAQRTMRSSASPTMTTVKSASREVQENEEGGASDQDENVADPEASSSELGDEQTGSEKPESHDGGADHLSDQSDEGEDFDPGDLDVLENLIDEDFEDYDGGSDSDWDDFPRVRRSMPTYLADKYSIGGSAQWTPFQRKLHKLTALTEGYPVMLNHWKFPYFAEWAIPPSYQLNSPLAPPAIDKRVVLKAYGDFFRGKQLLPSFA
jgi:hypothetical protein